MPKTLTNKRVTTTNVPAAYRESASAKSVKKGKQAASSEPLARYSVTPGGIQNELFFHRSFLKHPSPLLKYVDPPQNQRRQMRIERLQSKLEAQTVQSPKEQFEFSMDLLPAESPRESVAVPVKKSTFLLRYLQLQSLFLQPASTMQEDAVYPRPAARFESTQRHPDSRDSTASSASSSSFSAEAAPIPNAYYAQRRANEKHLRRVKRGDDLLDYAGTKLLFFSQHFAQHNQDVNPVVRLPFQKFDQAFSQMMQYTHTKSGSMQNALHKNLYESLQEGFQASHPTVQREILKRITFLEIGLVEYNQLFREIRNRHIQRFIEHRLPAETFHAGPRIGYYLKEIAAPRTIEDARLLVFSMVLHNQFTQSPIHIRALSKVSGEVVNMELHKNFHMGKRNFQNLLEIQKQFPYHASDFPGAKLFTQGLFESKPLLQGLLLTKSGGLELRTGFCFATASVMSLQLHSGALHNLEQADHFFNKLTALADLSSSETTRALRAIHTINYDVQATSGVIQAKRYFVSIDDVFQKALQKEGFLTLLGIWDGNEGGKVEGYHALDVSIIDAPETPEGKIYVIFDANVGHLKAFSLNEAKALLTEIVAQQQRAAAGGMQIVLGTLDLDMKALLQAKGRLGLGIPDLIYKSLPLLSEASTDFAATWKSFEQMLFFRSSPDTPLENNALVRATAVGDFVHSRSASVLSLGVDAAAAAVTAGELSYSVLARSGQRVDTLSSDIDMNDFAVVLSSSDDEVSAELARMFARLNINNSNSNAEGNAPETASLLSVLRSYLSPEARMAADATVSRWISELSFINRRITEKLQAAGLSPLDWEFVGAKSRLADGFATFRNRAQQSAEKVIRLSDEIKIRARGLFSDIDDGLKSISRNTAAQRAISASTKVMALYRAFVLSQVLQDYKDMTAAAQASVWVSIVDFGMDSVALLLGGINKVMKTAGHPLAVMSKAVQYAGTTAAVVGVAANFADVCIASYNLHVSQTPLQQELTGIQLGFATLQLSLSVIAIAFPPAGVFIMVAQMALNALLTYVMQQYENRMAQESVNAAFAQWEEEMHEISEVIRNAKIQVEEASGTVILINSKQTMNRILIQNGSVRAERNNKAFAVRFLKRFSYPATPYYRFEPSNFPHQEELKKRKPAFDRVFAHKWLQDESLAPCQEAQLSHQALSANFTLPANATDSVHIVLNGAQNIVYGIRAPVELASAQISPKMPQNAPHIQRQEQCPKLPSEKQHSWSVSAYGGVDNQMPHCCREPFVGYNDYHLGKIVNRGRPRTFASAEETTFYYIPSIAAYGPTTEIVETACLERATVFHLPPVWAYDTEKKTWHDLKHMPTGLKHHYPNSRLNQELPRVSGCPATCKDKIDRYPDSMTWKNFSFEVSACQSSIFVLQPGSQFRVMIKGDASDVSAIGLVFLEQREYSDLMGQKMPEDAIHLMRNMKVRKRGERELLLTLSHGASERGVDLQLLLPKEGAAPSYLFVTKMGLAWELDVQNALFRPKSLVKADYRSLSELKVFLTELLQEIDDAKSIADIMSSGLLLINDVVMPTQATQPAQRAMAYVFFGNPFTTLKSLNAEKDEKQSTEETRSTATAVKELEIFMKIWDEDLEEYMAEGYQQASLLFAQTLAPEEIDVWVPESLRSAFRKSESQDVTHWFNEKHGMLYVQYGQIPLREIDVERCGNKKPQKISRPDQKNAFVEIACEPKHILEVHRQAIRSQKLLDFLLEQKNQTAAGESEFHKILFLEPTLETVDEDVETMFAPLPEVQQLVAGAISLSTGVVVIPKALLGLAPKLLLTARDESFVIIAIETQNKVQAEATTAKSEAEEKEVRLYRLPCILKDSERYHDLQTALLEKKPYQALVPKAKRLLGSVLIHHVLALQGRNSIAVTTNDGYIFLVEEQLKESHLLALSKSTFLMYQKSPLEPLDVRLLFMQGVFAAGVPLAAYIVAHPGEPHAETSLYPNIPMVFVETQTSMPMYVDRYRNKLSTDIRVIGTQIQLAVQPQEEDEEEELGEEIEATANPQGETQALFGASIKFAQMTVFDPVNQILQQSENVHHPRQTRIVNTLLLEGFRPLGEGCISLKLKSDARVQSLPLLPGVSKIAFLPTDQLMRTSLQITKETLYDLEMFLFDVGALKTSGCLPKIAMQNQVAAAQYPHAKLIVSEYFEQSPAAISLKILKPTRDPSEPPQYLSLLFDGFLSLEEVQGVHQMSVSKEFSAYYEQHADDVFLSVAGYEYTVAKVIAMGKQAGQRYWHKKDTREAALREQQEKKASFSTVL